MALPSPVRAELPAVMVDTLSTAEVSKLFGVTQDTVRVWILHGQLEAFNVGTKECPRYRVPRRAVEAKFKSAETVP